MLFNKKALDVEGFFYLIIWLKNFACKGFRGWGCVLEIGIKNGLNFQSKNKGKNSFVMMKILTCEKPYYKRINPLSICI